MEDKKMGAFVDVNDIYDMLLEVDKKVDKMFTAFWVAGLVGVPAISAIVTNVINGRI